ncbi:hypothetical protein ACFPN4_07265 [Ureibacillus thermophilus]|uniref:hypothetical protein n=1 Tax=Ureibacillus thermophilus TaxID=367743 RepID=UPI00360DEC41
MKILWKKIRQLNIKRDINQTKMDFYSVLIPTILSTEIFKRNEDIRELVELFKVKISIKDYLYANRTALLARLIREIQECDEKNLEYNIKQFRKKTLSLIEEKGLINSSEVTEFINKYSRNKKVEINE